MAHAERQVHFASMEPGVARAAQAALGSIARHPGRSMNVELDASLAGLMEQILEVLAKSGGIAFGPIESVVSPEHAGKILGISRPLVVQRMDDGRLPFHYVGAHRRCKLTDVLDLKAAEEARNEALADAYADLMDLDDAPAP